MDIKWYGHASFGITTEDGLHIITDPYESGSYDGAVGYSPISDEADIVTVSHEHEDHNAVDSISGNPEVVREAGINEVKGIEFKGINTFHDKSEGAERGENTIYLFTVDGMKIAHLGDLGHIPDDEVMKMLVGLDVMFIPVGGHFTIDAEEAIEIIGKTNPCLVVPMHYKTEVLEFPIAPISEFTKRVVYNIKEVTGDTYELTMEKLPDETQVLLLNYVR